MLAASSLFHSHHIKRNKCDDIKEHSKNIGKYNGKWINEKEKWWTNKLREDNWMNRNRWV